MDITVLGLGLHFFIAMFFTIHVVRSGQQMYWLILLFLFPLLASTAYFFAIYLPGSRLEYGAKRIMNSAAKILDTQRIMHEAKAAFDELPTAQNQLRLAEAQLELGFPEEATKNYEACLKGPFASSLEIKFVAARALVESQLYHGAITHLEAIQNVDLLFRSAAVLLLLAQSHAGVGRNSEAQVKFEPIIVRFGTFEARAEYLIWALANKYRFTAEKLQSELNQITNRWTSQTTSLNAPIMNKIKAAYKMSGKPT